MPTDQWQKADELIHKVSFKNVSKVIKPGQSFCFDKKWVIVFYMILLLTI